MSKEAKAKGKRRKEKEIKKEKRRKEKDKKRRKHAENADTDDSLVRPMDKAVYPYIVAFLANVFAIVVIVAFKPASIHRTMVWLLCSLGSVLLKWAFFDPLFALLVPTGVRYCTRVPRGRDCCLRRGREKVVDAAPSKAP